MENNNKRYAVINKSTIIKRIMITIALIAIFGVSLKGINLDYKTFLSNLDQASFILKQFTKLDWTILPRVTEGMVLSISLAFVAMMISIFIAFPISLLAANNFTINRKLATFIKASVAVLRSIPMLVWGLMVVASLGFGNIGGVVTLLFTLNCFLIKVFATSIESLGNDVIEGMRATGAPWIVIAIKGVLPMALPSMLAWIAIGFEMAVATSISLGMIGINGVGKVLADSLAQYRYGEVSIGVLVIFLVMFTIEISTVNLKSGIKHEAK